MAMIVKPMNPAIYAEWNSRASLSLRLLIEFPPIAIGNRVSPTMPNWTDVATFLHNECSVFRCRLVPICEHCQYPQILTCPSEVGCGFFEASFIIHPHSCFSSLMGGFARIKIFTWTKHTPLISCGLRDHASLQGP